MLSRLLDWGSLEPFGPVEVVVNEWVSLLGVQDTGVVDDGRHSIWVDVGGWSSVLNVALSIVVHGLGWDSEGAGSVSASVGELLKGGGLVDSGESLVVVGSVELQVLSMLFLEFLHHVVDVGHLAGSSSHGLGGEVGVASGTVPVWEELWLEGDGESELFSASVEEISGDPHVVTALDTSAWSDLIFPLSWHDLSIGS